MAFFRLYRSRRFVTVPQTFLPPSMLFPIASEPSTPGIRIYWFHSFIRIFSGLPSVHLPFGLYQLFMPWIRSRGQSTEPVALRELFYSSIFVAPSRFENPTLSKYMRTRVVHLTRRVRNAYLTRVPTRIMRRRACNLTRFNYCNNNNIGRVCVRATEKRGRVSCLFINFFFFFCPPVVSFGCVFHHLQLVVRTPDGNHGKIARYTVDPSSVGRYTGVGSTRSHAIPNPVFRFRVTHKYKCTSTHMHVCYYFIQLFRVSSYARGNNYLLSACGLCFLPGLR